jgi:hypothetical protein
MLLKLYQIVHGIVKMSVPCRPGILTYMLQVKTRSSVCTHVLPRVLQPRTSLPCRGGLRRGHVSFSYRPCLPAEAGSGAATCPAASDPASLFRWAPTLPRAPRLRTSLPRKGGLRRCHVPHGFGLCLPEGRAPVPPRVPQLSAGCGPRE